MRFYLLLAALAAGMTFAYALVIWKLSQKYKLYPAIRERDVHERPTPRLGGLAIFLGMLTTASVAPQLQVPAIDLIFQDRTLIICLLIASFITVIMGLLDDLIGLDWMIKLAIQIIAALILGFGGIQLYSLPLGGVTIASPTIGLVITILIVVVTMNALNFIDGLDGLVSGVAIIANSVFFTYVLLFTRELMPSANFGLSMMISALIVGACLGFLPLNWHRAKMFLGDSGALLIGLLMAASALSIVGQLDPALVDQNSQVGQSDILPAFMPVLLPLVLLALPLLDFVLAVVRRLAAGNSPFHPDRKHIHHRLMDMGHSHLGTVLLFYAWTAMLTVSFLLMFILQPWRLALIFFGVGVLVCAVLTFWPKIFSKKHNSPTKVIEGKEQLS